MASNYEITCDFCGLVVGGKDTDFTVKSNNWRVSVDNSWLEPVKGEPLYEQKRDTEVYSDACLECAQKIAGLIKSIKPNQ